jgi:hypothetical protein
MGKSIITAAAGKVAARIENGDYGDLDTTVAKSHEHGVEGYVTDAAIAKLKKDSSALKRHIRDANIAGNEDQIELPGFERGALPFGVLVTRDGEDMALPPRVCSKEEVEAEIAKCRQKVNADNGRVSHWEETMRRINQEPESEQEAPLGEIIAAIQMRELGAGDA